MRQRLVKDENGNFIWVDVRKARKAPQLAIEKPVKGEALGCIKSQVDVMRADAKLNGFNDLNWVEDPEVPGFYDLEAPNQRRFEEYARHCDMEVKNGQFSGTAITSEELAAAERLAKERF